eukprot:423354_1
MSVIPPNKMDVDTSIQEKIVKKALDEARKGNDAKLLIVMSALDSERITDPRLHAVWYVALSQSVALMYPLTTHSKLFNSILKFDWLKMRACAREYGEFLQHLVSCHMDCLAPVLRALVRAMVPAIGTEDVPESDLAATHNAVQATLSGIRTLVPSMATVIFPFLVQNFPYKTRPTRHQVHYLKNLLRISEFAPELRDRILTLIAERLVQIDVDIRHEDEPSPTLKSCMERVKRETATGEDVSMDSDESKDSSEPSAEELAKQQSIEMASKLDMMMELMFQYLKMIHDSNDFFMLQQVFMSMLNAFEKSIVTTHQSKHTQFILFYICSFRTEYTETFLRMLLDRVVDDSKSQLFRQACASYIAGFVARGAFVRHISAVHCFDILNRYAHVYLERYEPQHKDSSTSPDHHQLFYAVCQAVFYIFVYRQGNFADRLSSSLLLDQSQNDHSSSSQPVADTFGFGSLIHSRLNPLLHCAPQVADAFADLTFRMRVLDCNAVLRANRRNIRRREKREQNNNKPASILTKHDSSSSTKQESSIKKEVKIDPESVCFDDPDKYLKVFFPFDPYHLPRSGKYLKGLYQHWKRNKPEENIEMDGETIEMSSQPSLTAPNSPLPRTPFPSPILGPCTPEIHQDLPILASPAFGACEATLEDVRRMEMAEGEQKMGITLRLEDEFSLSSEMRH